MDRKLPRIPMGYWIFLSNRSDVIFLSFFGGNESVRPGFACATSNLYSLLFQATIRYSHGLKSVPN